MSGFNRLPPSPPPPEVDFDKLIDVTINTDINLDVVIDFDKTFDACILVNSDVNIFGNLTNVSVEAEAYGWDTLVEVDTMVLTTDYLSSAYVSVISAVNG